ncbi:MAG TPA: FoF1 ATP synthase subunit a [Chloroflexia bacterium]|nr:FoF1 ATP synthase subunit a [Chloroflexia bacterium]
MEPQDQLNVSLTPEPIHIFGVTINNSLFTMIIVMIILAILMVSALARPKLVPGRWQAFWEFIVESVLNLVEGNLGRNKLARRLFPMIATFFIFILFANWFSLIPGIGSIGFVEYEIAPAASGTALSSSGNNPYGLLNTNVEVRQGPSETSQAVGHTLAANSAVKINAIQGDWANVVAIPEKGESTTFEPLTGAEAATGFVPAASLNAGQVGRILIPVLRAPNADLNMTLAMALIAVITANVVAIISHGVGGWVKEFFPKPYVMDPLLTPIEIVGQLSRIISLTFRLFGNVFAGEVLLAIILKLAAPALIIFLGLELFFGFIQALVFTSLSLAYIALGLGAEDHEHGEEATLDELAHDELDVART